MVSTPHKLPYIEKIGDTANAATYLLRVHLTPFTWWKLPRIYLHILGRPDEDREHHDHPWNFVTICLWGGYTETSHEMKDGRPTGKHFIDRLGFLSVRYRAAEHAHLITKIHGKRVITLIFRSNTRLREWGFWQEGWETVAKGKGLGAEMKVWKWVPWYTFVGKPKPEYESY